MSENLEDHELSYLIDLVKKDISEFNPKIFKEPKTIEDFFNKILQKLINQQKQTK
tara:strand:+ start:721 stop:885 length:165 start_codon:yes stop_codon:yes gene_type:complete